MFNVNGHDRAIIEMTGNMVAFTSQTLTGKTRQQVLEFMKNTVCEICKRKKLSYRIYNHTVWMERTVW